MVRKRLSKTVDTVADHASPAAKSRRSSALRQGHEARAEAVQQHRRATIDIANDAASSSKRTDAYREFVSSVRAWVYVRLQKASQRGTMLRVADLRRSLGRALHTAAASDWTDADEVLVAAIKRASQRSKRHDLSVSDYIDDLANGVLEIIVKDAGSTGLATVLAGGSITPESVGGEDRPGSTRALAESVASLLDRKYRSKKS